ncbi:hypothetical protein [Roseicyclus sp.]|uniref:hypothetical protein n=1 Tax=Roseicyclus sp. TaxID=1914329 RepID=UPI003F6BEFFA
MKRNTIALIIGLGLLSACGTPGALDPHANDAPMHGTEIHSESTAMHGQAGDVEFTLDDDVFTVERSRFAFLIALAFYLPFLVI